MSFRYKLEALVVLIMLTIFSVAPVSRLALDYLWFESLGYADVFLVKYKMGAALFIVFALLTAIILLLIYHTGIRSLQKAGGSINSLWDLEFFSGYPKEYVDMKQSGDMDSELRGSRQTVYVIVTLISLIIGFVVSGSWLKVLMYLNRTPFGVSDPVFNNDIAFYVFSLPFYNFLLNYSSSVLFIGLLVLGGLYATYNWKLLTGPPMNLKAVLAGYLTVLAVKTYLGRYNILYSETGVVYGAGYIDVAIRQYIPVFLSAVIILSALLILLGGLLKSNGAISITKVLAGMIAALVLISVFGGIATLLVQEYKVTPNELELERPFIMNNILMTNTAYDLDEVEVRQYPLAYNLSDDVLDHPSIVNARLWDYRPLMTTYQQKQAIRTYYGFNDVDVDRYDIDGTRHQVWLSVREIFYNQLRGKADTWLNKHVLYTHGIGVVMSPVNLVVDQGLPEMYIQNIPPVSSIPSLTIEQPRIYYGERTDTYIFTGTGRDEFDYPSGNTNVGNTYDGTGGISMSGLNKLIATIALGELKILTSSDIDADSKMHIQRDVLDRTDLIAPYLLQDSDAYAVIGDDGHIYWLVNAFVTSDRYPYSEPLWIGNNRVNYVQDSSKAVIDAYNGTVTYYVIEEDPLLTTYSKIFPGVFKPLDQMPDDIKQHMRYSPDMFLIQSSIYTDYHMKVPDVFYNREDRWQSAKEKYGNSLIQVEPYNVLLELDNSTDFILMLPFTPANKDNLIAWMAVDQDYPDYGRKILYEFSKDKLIYGPAQIEALIDQDEDISKDLTLWNQGGSSVIRGNLLVIPIKGSLLYIEPLYISAESASSIPELKKILVVYENRVAMEDTLEEALLEVIGANVTVSVPTAPTEAETGDMTLTELLDDTISHYEKAQEYLKTGDLENYGREMKIVDSLMERLAELVEESAG